MANNKQRVYEDLEIEVNGQPFRGYRVLEGTLNLVQYVVFKENCLPDLIGYRPADKDTLMLSMAKQLLRELVTGRTISAQPLEKFNL